MKMKKGMKNMKNEKKRKRGLKGVTYIFLKTVVRTLVKQLRPKKNHILSTREKKKEKEKT